MYVQSCCHSQIALQLFWSFCVLENVGHFVCVCHYHLGKHAVNVCICVCAHLISCDAPRPQH